MALHTTTHPSAYWASAWYRMWACFLLLMATPTRTLLEDMSAENMQLDNLTVHFSLSVWVWEVGGVNMLSWLAIIVGMLTEGREGGAVSVRDHVFSIRPRR